MNNKLISVLAYTCNYNTHCVKSKTKFKFGPLEIHIEESLLTKKINYVLYIFNLRLLNILTIEKDDNDNKIIKILNLIKISNTKEETK